MEIHLSVDFERQLFSGECNLVVKKLTTEARHVLLDVLDLELWIHFSSGGFRN